MCLAILILLFNLFILKNGVTPAISPIKKINTDFVIFLNKFFKFVCVLYLFFFSFSNIFLKLCFKLFSHLSVFCLLVFHFSFLYINNNTYGYNIVNVFRFCFAFAKFCVVKVFSCLHN